ncbi:MBL fold metallo-hydrolase [Pseudomonas moorei]|nr:MBL fold metallo-hydrolase [Pseudomonas moorei]
MQIQQVRHATLIINYAGIKFLIDPMLAEKDSQPGFEGTANSHLRNPTVALPWPMERILDVDAVIVTHSHPDHWDEAAKALVPKHLPMFVQDDADAAMMRSDGFSDVRLLTTESEFQGISLVKTSGQHGSDQAMEIIGEFLGTVCGVIFRGAEEKTLYLAGDTLWNEQVQENLREYTPEVVVLNSGDSQVLGIGSITMSKEDVYEVHKEAPNAILVATHMEAVNHAVLSRAELREFAIEKGMSDRLFVPEDGEMCVL